MPHGQRIAPLEVRPFLLDPNRTVTFEGTLTLGTPYDERSTDEPGFEAKSLRNTGEKHAIACPSALIGASNFFELAVAAAISLFGFQSGAALATVVGVLIEVPVMLLVVKIVNQSRGWYEANATREVLYPIDGKH